MNVLKPREAVPALEVETLDGPWSLADQNPENFTLVVFLPRPALSDLYQVHR